MGSGASQFQFTALDPVNHYPVTFEMRVAVPNPISLQRVVLIARRQCFTTNKQVKETLQLAQVLVATRGFPYVFLEFTGPNRR